MISLQYLCINKSIKHQRTMETKFIAIRSKKINKKGEISYIYTINGKKIRSSKNIYDYACINSEDLGCYSCGKYETCASWLSSFNHSVEMMNGALAFLDGKISFRELMEIYGKKFSMGYKPSDFTEAKRERYIKFRDERAAELAKMAIVKFEDAE